MTKLIVLYTPLIRDFIKLLTEVVSLAKTLAEIRLTDKKIRLQEIASRTDSN